MYTDKNKGAITFFVILVIAFISWTIFTSSFMISQQAEVLRTKKESEETENRERLLEVIFHNLIKEIDREINEKNLTDIVWYFMEKDGVLIWTQNYDNFTSSDRGCIITEIKINDWTYQFSENSKNFYYDRYITNGIYTDTNKKNQAQINFYKIWKDITIEGEPEKYNIKMEGDLFIDYFRAKGEEKEMTGLKMGEFNFEIY